MLLQPALNTATPGKTGPSEALATAIIFAMTQGPVIRERMAKDPSFRQQFNSLWEALNRVVNGQTNSSQRLLLIAMEPHIWDLLLWVHSQNMTLSYKLLKLNNFLCHFSLHEF